MSLALAAVLEATEQQAAFPELLKPIPAEAVADTRQQPPFQLFMKEVLAALEEEERAEEPPILLPDL